MSEVNTIKSMQKSVHILTCLSESRGSLPLEEVTRRTGLKKTTCFRLLQSMMNLDLLEQEPGTKKYRLGPKIISLGLAALSELNLHKIARPLMKKLRDETGETVNLSILDGTDILFIERFRSSHLFNINLFVGSRLPVFCTSQGKALLAHLPETRVDQILHQINSQKDDKTCVVNADALKQNLAHIREKGFAFSDEELEKGLCAVAAPIMNHDGQVIAAINVSWAKARHPDKQTKDRFARQVVRVAQKISASLGFTEKTGQLE